MARTAPRRAGSDNIRTLPRAFYRDMYDWLVSKDRANALASRSHRGLVSE